MSAERLDLITATSQRYVDEGKLAGVVTLVARDGKIVHFEAVGQRGADDDRAMTTDALFRIYSMSKPITGGRGDDALRTGQVSRSPIRSRSSYRSLPISTFSSKASWSRPRAP